VPLRQGPPAAAERVDPDEDARPAGGRATTL